MNWSWYQAWRDEKDAEPKVKKPVGKDKCKICNARVNGLKDHVEGKHGKGMWKKYRAAEEYILQREQEKFIMTLRNM